MNYSYLALLTISLVFPALASAQMPEKGSYSECDLHVVKSTVCGWNYRDETGNNISHLTLREENDTAGLTYLSFECDGAGKMVLYLQSKNPLVSQRDFDAEQLPKVSYRLDNGSLKGVPVYQAYEADSNGEAIADLGALLLGNQVFQQITNASKRFQLVVERQNLSKLVYNFPIYGLDISIKTINYCK